MPIRVLAAWGWVMNSDQMLQAVGLVTVFLYATVMFLARAHLIAWNSIHGLEGRTEAVAADVAALALPGGAQQGVTQLVGEVRALTRRAGSWRARLLSSGGEENQGWEMIHHAEEIVIANLGDDEVLARLHRGRADLARDETACGKAWRTLVDRHLDSDGNRKAGWTAPAARADLVQLVEYCHRKQDETFRALADVSNKTQWLVVTGLVLIGATIVLAPNVVVLLGLGAVGGLASGIRRIASAKALPTDYGAYWAPLFLAPVLGALLGWTGVYLVELAQTMNILGSAVPAMATPYDPVTYGLAVLFGFTEGAFNGVADLVNKSLTTAPAASTGQASAAPAPQP